MGQKINEINTGIHSFVMAVFLVADDKLIGGGGFHDVEVVSEDATAGSLELGGRMLGTLQPPYEGFEPLIREKCDGYVAHTIDPEETYTSITLRVKT